MNITDSSPRRQDAEAWDKIDQLQRELDQLKERLGRDTDAARLLVVTSHVVADVIRSRRARESLFGTDLFFDPAWDILLELFQAHLSQQRVAVSELARSVAIPATTGLRWMDQLEQCGLVTRRPDPLDGRRVFIELSATGVSAMETYFDRWPAGRLRRIEPGGFEDGF